MFDLGPLMPVSSKACKMLDRIARMLEKTPKNEWQFVLLRAKKKAEENLEKKNKK